MNYIKRYRVAAGFVLLLLSIFFLISTAAFNTIDYTGLVNGKSTLQHGPGPLVWVGYIFRSGFGVAAYLIPLLFFLAGISLQLSNRLPGLSLKISALLILSVTSAPLVSMLRHTVPQFSGGYFGYYISETIISIFGHTGSYIVLSIINITALISIILINILPLFNIKRAATPEGTPLFPGKTTQKNKKNIPLIHFNKNDRTHKKRIPWLTRKNLIIFESEEIRAEPENNIRLVEMSDNINSAIQTLNEIHYLPETPADTQNNNSLETIIFDNRKSGTNHFQEIAPVPEKPVISEYADESHEEAYIEVHEVKNREYPDNNKNRITDLQIKEESENPESIIDTTPVPEVDRHTESPDEQCLDDVDIHVNQDYIIPTSFLTFSEPADEESWKREIKKNSSQLVTTLAEFGIESKVINVNRGPVITLYEIQIAPGIKVNRIVNLSDDIAMALAASPIRIIAPIPGKSAIGIEVPNKIREMVTLGDIIHNSTSQENNSKKGSMIVGLGKDILGNPITLDLKKLPHLLIAGATGSGKSVCVNSIITSLIYNYDPEYVRFIMVDPKMVELQLYNGLPHLLTPVITEPQTAPMVLKWALYEMERRYHLLSDMNTRDITRYNEMVEQKGTGHERLPFIVIIIDELADLMMVASKEIEGYITRIAQKARAIGIHLVFATQRPSVDIITGIIKANFPARIAFQVAQKTDSRTIIDQNGAEKLLGRGDMLYQSPISSFPVRIQGAYISEDEINKIVAHLSTLYRPSYIDIEESISEEEEKKADDASTDELFKEAMQIIQETRKASASYLQRRLSIGYNRAARIIEQMEEMGYVGAQQGSKPREVYI